MAIIGSILGDIAGSQIEFRRPQGYDYKTAELFTENCKFTDDTVLTIATKEAILKGDRIGNYFNFESAYRYYGNKYSGVGYGGMFFSWLESENPKPYNSYGNGSAMRISPLVDRFYQTPKTLETIVKISAATTHNHPEGIKGALVTARAILMAKQGANKQDILEFGIKEYPKSKYIYSCEKSLNEVRNGYHWNATCQGSVPLAIRCIYEADNYEEFLRNVFSVKCDTDTIACIGGGIAEELFRETGFNNFELLSKYLPKEFLQIIYTEY